MTDPGNESAYSALPSGKSHNDYFDTAGVYDIFQGDKDLLRDMVSLFDRESVRLLADMRQAITTNDHRTLERTAHKLKGSIGSFCGRQSFQSAVQLEIMAKGQDLTGAPEAVAQLEKDVRELTAALVAHLNE